MTLILIFLAGEAAMLIAVLLLLRAERGPRREKPEENGPPPWLVRVEKPETRDEADWWKEKSV